MTSKPNTTMQCSFCPKVFNNFAELSEHVRTEHSAEAGLANSNTMQHQTTQATDGSFPPALPRGSTVMTGDIPTDDYVGGAYLKGSDIPDNIMVVRIKVLQFINDPKGMSKLTVQIPDTYGKTLFGLNTTNVRALQAKSIKNLKDIIGKTLVLSVGMQPNPQRGGALVKSLFVTGLE